MEVLNNFISIYCLITFIIGAMFMFVTSCIAAMGKVEKPMNKIHFYVARDKNSRLWLYIGKPVRTSNEFSPCHYGKLIAGVRYFSNYGLKESDFINLNWEDEPVEVFLKLED